MDQRQNCFWYSDRQISLRYIGKPRELVLGKCMAFSMSAKSRDRQFHHGVSGTRYFVTFCGVGACLPVYTRHTCEALLSVAAPPFVGGTEAHTGVIRTCAHKLDSTHSNGDDRFRIILNK
ncbi:unnamed protein product [Ectocarpus sp. 12 AP-2014]